ncbi:hypothetical protein F0562_032219 [Nyssa sinensis]|uniref:Uncharacterized protein n=1 Tax=Nyssa sinensis TaxID=561372 RepID=A0A5J5AY51_9ASTE|nr:hypothetical protein F0562_032219 [Nyssa sinensis]
MLSVSNSTEFEGIGESGESNFEEVDSVEIGDAPEPRGPKANHFTSYSLDILKITYNILATISYRKKRAIVVVPTTSILAKRVTLADASSLEKTRTEEHDRPTEVALTLGEIEDSKVRITDVVGTSNPLKTGRGKEVTTTILDKHGPLMSFIDDAIKMGRDLSLKKVPEELAQVSVTLAVHTGFISLSRACHIMATLKRIKYESHDLEA